MPGRSAWKRLHALPSDTSEKNHRARCGGAQGVQKASTTPLTSPHSHSVSPRTQPLRDCAAVLASDHSSRGSDKVQSHGMIN
ncbi:hypothetical protein E2C01_083748 [Portunus trituberculatus]|uniref:Uncharacterized protein n=1 Tax=Portunus trituberculatus TaxID=210409 RepID=A0A5B7J5P0_PORTR|nr:hypothetical protein [Portunus trituberculatus]